MAKWQNDTMLNQSLNWIKNNATKVCLCAGQPANYTAATTSYSASASSALKIGSVSVSSADFTLADGDVSGRKVTVGAQSSVNADVTGTINHIAIVGSVSSVDTLLYVTTCASQAVTNGDKVDVPAWKIEIKDAA